MNVWEEQVAEVIMDYRVNLIGHSEAIQVIKRITEEQIIGNDLPSMSIGVKGYATTDWANRHHNKLKAEQRKALGESNA